MLSGFVCARSDICEPARVPIHPWGGHQEHWLHQWTSLMLIVRNSLCSFVPLFIKLNSFSMGLAGYRGRGRCLSQSRQPRGRREALFKVVSIQCFVTLPQDEVSPEIFPVMSFTVITHKAEQWQRPNDHILPPYVTTYQQFKDANHETRVSLSAQSQANSI